MATVESNNLLSLEECWKLLFDHTNILIKTFENDKTVTKFLTKTVIRFLDDIYVYCKEDNELSWTTLLSLIKEITEDSKKRFEPGEIYDPSKFSEINKDLDNLTHSVLHCLWIQNKLEIVDNNGECIFNIKEQLEKIVTYPNTSIAVVNAVIAVLPWFIGVRGLFQKVPKQLGWITTKQFNGITKLLNKNYVSKFKAVEVNVEEVTKELFHKVDTNDNPRLHKQSSVTANFQRNLMDTTSDTKVQQELSTLIQTQNDLDIQIKSIQKIMEDLQHKRMEINNKIQTYGKQEKLVIRAI